MDYAFLPPEINSARIYTGPGPGAFLAAAGSWDSLAAELSTTAETYESVLSGLTSLQWRGPASQAMAATAAPYVGWLYTTAEQTQQTAIQARAAAAAFEQAYATTVPPPAIAANRTQLTALIATNFFGQNTAAIAATEAQYAEMWAQDATALYGYASSSAAATTLTPFVPPRQTTNPAGQTAQSAAVAQANSSAAAADPMSQLIAALTQIAYSLFPGTGQFELLPVGFSSVDAALLAYSSINGVEGVEQFVANIPMAGQALQAMNAVPAAAAAAAPAAAAPVESSLAPFLASAQQSVGAAPASGLGGLPNAVTASLARANSIGPMSVPASWSAPSSSHVAALQPAGLTTLPGTDEAAGSGYPGYPGMPAGTVARASGVLPRYGTRLTVMPRPPAAG
jgi:PPE-repeat protein